MERNTLRTVLVGSVLCGFLFVSAGVCRAGNWPGWRGPTGMGTTDEKDLPLTWDAKTGDGILWKASLKGTTGHSCPIVWGDKVFLTTAARQSREQESAKEVPEHYLTCYQASDGKELWKTAIPQGKMPAGYAIYAVPTPVTDGKAVYMWFGSGVAAAVDFDGKVLWRHEREGPLNLNPGICSSLTLFGDTVLLLIDQGRGKGVLQALDKKTGEVKWEQKRTKSGCNNTTPILIQVGGKPQLVILGEGTLEGLNPATGEQVWWCKARGFGESPVCAGGMVYADKGGNETAACVDPTGTGDVTETKVKWHITKSAGDYGSPVIVGEYIYKPCKDGVVGCRKVADGSEVFKADLKGVSKLASPFATADGRVYFVNGGTSYVLKAGPKAEVLATNDLRNGGNGSSPAVADGRIYIRGSEWLFCIGKK